MEKLPFVPQALLEDIEKAKTVYRELIRMGITPERKTYRAQEKDRAFIEGCSVPKYIKIEYVSENELPATGIQRNKISLSKLIPPETFQINERQQTVSSSGLVYKPKSNAFYFIKALWDFLNEGQPLQHFNTIVERVNKEVPGKGGAKISSKKIDDIFKSRLKPNPKDLIESPKGRQGFWQLKVVHLLNDSK